MFILPCDLLRCLQHSPIVVIRITVLPFVVLTPVISDFAVRCDDVAFYIVALPAFISIYGFWS